MGETKNILGVLVSSNNATAVQAENMSDEKPSGFHSRKPFEQIGSAISRARDILVTTHLRMDGDAVGSTTAFAEMMLGMGKRVTLVNPTPVASENLFLLENLSYVNSPEEDRSYDLLVCLDCANSARLGVDIEKFSQIQTINIDHHVSNEFYASQNWVDAEAPCVGMMLLELFEALGYPISPRIATCLYASLTSDTGRFSFSNTTAQAFQVAKQLVELGAKPAVIATELYFKKSPQALRFQGFLYSKLEFTPDSRIAYIAITEEDLNLYGLTVFDTEGIVDIPRLSAISELAIFFLEVQSEEITRMSLRSKSGFNCSLLASHFGGGGHRGASGARLSQNLEFTRKAVLKKALEMMNEEA